MTITLGSDHAGYALRRLLAGWLLDQGYAVSEVGATDETAYDYPDAAIEVCRRMLGKEADMGILICGTGIGMAMAANRLKGIRAATCWSKESARLARQHNHANVLCLGARLIKPEDALEILKTFMDEKPSLEERHLRRLGKVDELGENLAQEAGCGERAR
ncbi:MAG: ribose 5-phosphate isomerase B [Candidatus Caldarchaeum sp.]